MILHYIFILAAEPGTASIGSIFFRAWPWCWQNLCCSSSESQTSERCCLLPSPLTLQMNTHSHAHHGDAQPPCSHTRPARCSDRAGGSAALPHPSSRSSISLLEENYRFFSEDSFLFPRRFLASHSSCQSSGESVPNTTLLHIRLGWWSCGFHRFLHPPFSDSGCVDLSKNKECN